MGIMEKKMETIGLLWNPLAAFPTHYASASIRPAALGEKPLLIRVYAQISKSEKLPVHPGASR